MGGVTEALALVGDAAAPGAVQHQGGLAGAVVGAHCVDAAAAFTSGLLVCAFVIIWEGMGWGMGRLPG